MTRRQPPPHFYTLAEANARLPELTTVLNTMQAQTAMLAPVQEQLAQLRQTLRLNGNAAHAEALARQVQTLEADLRTGFDQLQHWGIELRDLDRGLVDFPHRRGGRVVYLCWLLGEPQVDWWHETNTGFSGRQPISTL